MPDNMNPAISSITSSSASSSSSTSSRIRSESLHMAEDKEQSLADEQQNLTVYSDDRIYLPSFATEQALSGKYEYARQLFDCWINEKCGPDDYRIFFNRAICNYELEDFDKALADVNVAIRMNDKWPKGESESQWLSICAKSPVIIVM